MRNKVIVERIIKENGLVSYNELRHKLNLINSLELNDILFCLEWEGKILIGEKGIQYINISQAHTKKMLENSFEV